MPKRALPAFVAILIALPASAESLLDKMHNQTKDGPVYAYEMTYSVSDMTATGRIDPSQPEGDRINIFSPAEADWSDDFRDGLADMEAGTDGDIWCVDFADTVPTNAAKTGETENSATYAFTPLPEADSDGMEKKLMKKIKAEIILDKSDGAVLGFKMHLPKPFKPAFIAKINVFDMQVSCARAPDGRTYVQDFSMAVSGSAMMQKFDESMSRQITALLDPVG